MKFGKLHVVEGDPKRGGCHVKRMADVLHLNKQAYLAGEPRESLVLAAAASLEEANAMRRSLVSERGRRAACDTEQQKKTEE